MKNNSFKEIAEVLKEAGSIVIFPHILMDGDALGSAAALCGALRSMGKDAVIAVEDKIPDYLQFLDKGYCERDLESYMNPDVSICVDCGELKRFPERAGLYNSGKIKICVDHHETSPGIADYNYIDGKAAATGELIYDLLLAMECTIDGEIANAIYAAITTDTGNFQYSNTTKRSHEIVMELYDSGLDSYGTSVALYENESFEKMKLQSAAINDSEVFAGGKAIIAEISLDMLKKYGARMEDTEGIVGMMRSIKGVDIAVLLKEKEPGNIKASLRAKHGDVSKIAVAFKGGGHEKAAGCTIYDSMAVARDIIMKAVSEELCRE